jgi:hypothetical protein
LADVAKLDRARDRVDDVIATWSVAGARGQRTNDR